MENLPTGFSYILWLYGTGVILGIGFTIGQLIVRWIYGRKD